MGEALDGLDKTQDALAEFQRAAEIAPKEPNLHFGVGFLYWKLNRYADAEREFNAELALDPQQAQALAYLGDIEFKRNNLDRAKTILQKSVKIESTNRIAYLDLGSIFTQQETIQGCASMHRLGILLEPRKIQP